jgi:hypothetical protein
MCSTRVYSNFQLLCVRHRERRVYNIFLGASRSCVHNNIMPNKKKAKASTKKASKVLQEVDFTFESTPLKSTPEQSKGN